MSEQRFTVIPTDMLFSTELSPTAKLLYALMSSYGQRGRGVVWPSQHALSSAAGLTERQLRRLLVDLEAAGFIAKTQTVKVNGQFGRNEYELRGFEVVSCVEDRPSDIDVPRPPSDIHVRHRRTSMSGREQEHGSRTYDQEQALRAAV